MAIYFKRVYQDLDLMYTQRDAQHEALVGSPAYINSEIAIIEEDANSFTVCIGIPNGNDINLTLNVTE